MSDKKKTTGYILENGKTVRVINKDGKDSGPCKDLSEAQKAVKSKKDKPK